MHARAARFYKQVDLTSSSKVKILDRLYSRLLKDIQQAKQAIDLADVSTRVQAIDHALQITTELNAALDFQVAQDLCQNLASLYGYVIDRLESANVHNEAVYLDQASLVVAELQESFQLAAQNQ